MVPSLYKKHPVDESDSTTLALEDTALELNRPASASKLQGEEYVQGVAPAAWDDVITYISDTLEVTPIPSLNPLPVYKRALIAIAIRSLPKNMAIADPALLLQTVSLCADDELRQLYLSGKICLDEAVATATVILRLLHRKMNICRPPLHSLFDKTGLRPLTGAADINQLGLAYITAVGEQNIYVQKGALRYYFKADIASEYQVGPFDFKK